MEVNGDNHVHRITLPVGRLDLQNPVDQNCLIDGNVGQFLEQLEVQIRTSLRALMKTAIPKIDVNKIDTRDPMLNELPLQVLVTAYFVGFTSQLQKAMDEGTLQEAVSHFKCIEQTFIGLMLDQRPEPLRQRLITLLTVVVAFYGLAQRLLNGGEMNEECVELWRDTPRWVFDGDKVQVITHQNSRFKGTAVMNYIDYGYQLLDFQQLLVHTPLTFRIYSGIVSCNVGVMGAQGPAGTGKTESIKDFCNLCGIQAVVHAASEKTTEEDIANLYDFCDATHTVIVDEFNKCNIKIPQNKSGI